MNLKQHHFVTEYLRTGDKALAYANAYNCPTASYRTLESSANRLLKKPEVAQAIGDTLATVRHQVQEELKEQLKEELLSIHQKRLLLKKIAEGTAWVEQTYKGKNCTQCTQLVKPTISQMLRAIDLDSRLAGHYPDRRKTDVVHPHVPVKEFTPRSQEEEYRKPQQKTTNLTPRSTCGEACPELDLGGLGVRSENSYALREADRISVSPPFREAGRASQQHPDSYRDATLVPPGAGNPPSLFIGRVSRSDGRVDQPSSSSGEAGVGTGSKPQHKTTNTTPPSVPVPAMQGGERPISHAGLRKLLSRRTAQNSLHPV